MILHPLFPQLVPCYACPMILEQAVLDVKTGQAAQFEAAFAQAEAIIASMSGYRGHTLQRCLEMPSRFLLLVNWETLEDHTVGFRESAEYQSWRSLLHHFYDPFPTVHHYESISGQLTLQ